MRWGTIRLEDGTPSAALCQDGKVVSVVGLNAISHRSFPTELEAIITADVAGAIISEAVKSDAFLRIGIEENAVHVLAPLTKPERIVGIGLNYGAHAHDLDEKVPEEPATFLKPQASIIGPGDVIRIPRVSKRTTAEAEVALVFSRSCKDVSSDRWQQVVFGMVPVLDMTTEDILRRNPRFLTRSKGYDSFFSFGPWIATLDEFTRLDTIRVQTVVNGEIRAENQVSGMTYGLAELVEFITTGSTIGASAILSTGTPGAAPIAAGDVVEARVEGFPALLNPVEDAL
ncbi:fumarylacetoacetate hydrolase family protein [Sulfobacillus harzensis]|uniref:Fumarylacetoacetate hydrolase family protein n=1 Tax=Sulfobacillus harzensis TaxID=2729629 RepID=A0A7Y0Q1J7_9FIRM|nr:fumarylacetoacetate hydrolase family protein [Sulfobacillus harzensis]NMP21395.1 fumarylacetoacetate hydrolase family protein [Sulfobacillus harzensis]